MYTLPKETNGPVDKGWEPLPDFMKSIPSEHDIPDVSKDCKRSHQSFSYEDKEILKRDFFK